MNISDKITSYHLARLAIVYIRQSSPGQVKNNPESYRVQKRLVARAEECGWLKNKIRVIQGDQGTSARYAGQRDAFNEVLEMIRKKEVGIVLGQDASRLARNSLDWSLLTHWCGLHGALIGDQNQVLDPSLPQDSLVLGIQGALAVHELHTIRARMEAGLSEKAARGELHLSVPQGYVVVDGKHLRKHPDRRVQQAIERIFEAFRGCPSVIQLVFQLRRKNYLLPRPMSGDGMKYEMVDPSYGTLLGLLKNPKYSGLYVYPRCYRETIALPDGTVKKTVRVTPPGEWDVCLPDNHPAYITLAEFESNQEKIAMNAQRNAPSSRSAANKGSALLPGLIQCRRCHRKMQVHYGSHGRATYVCKGRTRRGEQAWRDCLRLPADELERQLSEQILHAVSPVGVRAALLASERLAAEHTTQRSILGDDLEQLRYEADLARRRFDNVDPANTLVLQTLASELESALQAVVVQESALAQFDQEQLPRPTEAEQAELEHLGTHLEQVWNAPQADARLKQQIVRVLIEHVLADVDESTDESVLWLHWSGGHHTELRAPRRKQGRRREEDLTRLIDTLRKIADDDEISRALNRCKIPTKQGKTWTARQVSRYRKQHNIASYDTALKQESGWLSQSEAATKLEISPMSLHRLIQRGILPSEGESGLPQVIQLSDLNRKEVTAAVQHIKSHGNAPLPENPKQISLYK